MALPYNTLNTQMLPWVAREAHDNVYYFDAFTARLRSKAQVRAFKYKDLPLEYAMQDQGGWYSGFATYNPHQPEILTKARYTRKNIVEPFLIPYEDEMDASTPDKVLDIVKVRSANAVKRVQTALRSAIFGDATVSAVEGSMVTGLKNFVATANPTTWYVGGIDRDDTTAWQGKWLGQVFNKDTSGYGQGSYIKLTPAKLRKVIRAVEKMPSGSPNQLSRPSLIVTTYEILSLMGSWTAEKQRFNYMGKTKPDYGWDGLKFEGIDVMASYGCDTGYLYVLSEDHYGMVVQSGYDVILKPIHPVEEGTGSIGQVCWSGAIWCDAPEKLAVMKDIDVDQ